MNVKEYFDEYIYGFIYHDIEFCINAKANYVVALALLSYTEYLGGLITGDLGEDKKSENNFNNALKYFNDNSYYSNFLVNLDGEEKNIYKIFRCGLVHEYFSKGLCSIDNISSSDISSNYLDHLKGIYWENDKVVFNNNAYFRDFKIAVDKIYNLLLKDDTNFVKIINRINNRTISEVKQE